jgi:hydrogenase expression/formation protein HypC
MAAPIWRREAKRVVSRRRSGSGVCRCASRALGENDDAMCLAIPGRILEISDEDIFFRTGRVSFGGIVKQVSLACVPEAGVGDYVLVHAGLALSVVDEVEAEKVFSFLEEMGEAEGRPPPAAPP